MQRFVITTFLFLVASFSANAALRSDQIPSKVHIGVFAENTPNFTSNKFLYLVETELGYIAFLTEDALRPRDRFISRDPLGYIDGMSLYAGYFAQRFMLDPWGNDTKNTPGTRYFNLNVKNKIIDFSKDTRKLIRETYDRGCIGLTCLALGTPNNPDLSNCFSTLARAKSGALRAKCKKCTKNPFTKGGAIIFSLRFWKGKNKYTIGKKNKVNMDSYNFEPKPPTDDKHNIPFDFGLLKNSRWIHANQSAPNMVVKSSTLESYSEPISIFNGQVFCYACAEDKLYE